MPIYKVEIQQGNDPVKVKLVRAKTPSQAIRHAVLPMVWCKVATIDEVVGLVQEGINPEDAGVDPATRE